ncbi:MAG: hypothetical protein ACYS8X_07700 [Planctomycetota bacterium]|jgi:hypothetical protein
MLVACFDALGNDCPAGGRWVYVQSGKDVTMERFISRLLRRRRI